MALADKSAFVGGISRFLEFSKEQLELMLVPAHGHRFSSLLKSVSGCAYERSPTLYRYMKNFIILPHRRYVPGPFSRIFIHDMSW